MSACPYQKLFIYEIQGEFNLPPAAAVEDFLGCWREGECSYLFFTQKKETDLKKLLGEVEAERYLSETVDRLRGLGGRPSLSAHAHR